MFLKPFLSLKAENKKSSANELTLDSVGGVFVVLLAGMGIACATSVIEFLWKGKAKNSKAKDSSMVVKALANTNSNIFKIAGMQQEVDRTLAVVSIKRSEVENNNYLKFQTGKDKLSLKHLRPLTPLLTSHTFSITPNVGVLRKKLAAPTTTQTQSIQLLDLTSGHPYRSLSEQNLPIHQSHYSLCGDSDQSHDPCCATAKHPYCSLHCTNKHITYHSVDTVTC